MEPPEQKPSILTNLPEILKNRRNKKRSYDISLKKIAEYTLANEFELLLTVTFDPRRLHNYTPNAARSAMQTWLFRQTIASRNADKDFKYIVFPDVSQDKHLLEFHVLLSGHVFPLKRSGIVVDGSLVYTVKQFNRGFTKVRSVTGLSKQEVFELVVQYLDNNAYELFNGRRYWPSRSLDEIEAFENKNTRLQASINLDAVNALGVIESVE